MKNVSFIQNERATSNIDSTLQEVLSSAISTTHTFRHESGNQNIRAISLYTIAHIYANLVTELRTRAPPGPSRTALIYPGCTFF
jgi:hypothetical protein